MANYHAVSGAVMSARGSTQLLREVLVKRREAAMADTPQLEREAGAKAYYAGKSSDDNPHFSGTIGAKWWSEGFLGTTGRGAHARETAREAEAEIRISRRYEHRARYAEVAEKLSALGIDPYQLRDYLAGLPEED